MCLFVLCQDAIAANSFFPSTEIPSLVKGDVTTALASSAHVVSGTITMSAQRHLYMEVQNAVAKYTDDGLEMVVSTQVSPVLALACFTRFHPMAKKRTGMHALKTLTCRGCG